MEAENPALQEPADSPSDAAQTSAAPNNTTPHNSAPTDAMPSNAMPSNAMPSNAMPSNAEADALVEALGKLRGRRGAGGGPGIGMGRRGGGRMGRGQTPAQGVGNVSGHGRGSDRGPGLDAGHGHGHRERTGGPALLRLLGTLARSEDPLSISELAEHIGVDQPRASRLVQQAVEHGHAVREADPQDARRSRVRLTPQGEQLVHGVRSRQREDASTALAALDSQERAELLRLIGKLAQAWPRQSGGDA